MEGKVGRVCQLRRAARVREFSNSARPGNNLPRSDVSLLAKARGSDMLRAAVRQYETTPSDDHQPMMWLQGHAIYAAHFLVVLFTTSMLVTTLLGLLKLQSVLAWLTFDSNQVWHGQVWRILTYGMVNVPSIWFVVSMFMLFRFGHELEKFFGRRQFLIFYGSLYLFTPLLFTLIGLWTPIYWAGSIGSLGVFIAFATLYPGAVMMFNILAKWMAVVLVGILTLTGLNDRNWSQLATLWAATGYAYVYIRYHQGHFSLPRWRLGRSTPHLRVLPDLPAEKMPAIRGQQGRLDGRDRRPAGQDRAVRYFKPDRQGTFPPR